MKKFLLVTASVSLFVLVFLGLVVGAFVVIDDCWCEDDLPPATPASSLPPELRSWWSDYRHSLVKSVDSISEDEIREVNTAFQLYLDRLPAELRSRPKYQREPVEHQKVREKLRRFVDEDLEGMSRLIIDTLCMSTP